MELHKFPLYNHKEIGDVSDCTPFLEWVSFNLHFHSFLAVPLGWTFKVSFNDQVYFYSAFHPITIDRLKTSKCLCILSEIENGVIKTNKCLCISSKDWNWWTPPRPKWVTDTKLSPRPNGYRCHLCWKGWANAPLAVELFKWVQCTSVGKFPFLLPFLRLGIAIGFHDYTYR